MKETAIRTGPGFSSARLTLPAEVFRAGLAEDPSSAHRRVRLGPGFEGRVRQSRVRVSPSFYGKLSKPLVRRLARAEMSSASHVESLGGDCGAKKVGDLSTYGVSGFIFNHAGKKGQDALAINKLDRRFVVADGLGGTAGGRAEVQQLSMAASSWVAEKGIKSARDPILRKEFLDRFASKEGVSLSLPFKGKSMGVKTTLSAVELGDTLPDGRREAQILAIGDSPIFVCDREGKVMKQFGEDAMSGLADNGLANALGYDSNGLPKDCENTSQIVDETVMLEPGQLIAVASDYFSDLVAKQRQNGVEPTLAEYMSIESPSAYQELVTGPRRAKGDDATVIFIDPGRI